MNPAYALALLKTRLNRLEADLHEARAGIERLETRLCAGPVTSSATALAPSAGSFDPPGPQAAPPAPGTPPRAGGDGRAHRVVEPPPLPVWLGKTPPTGPEPVMAPTEPPVWRVWLERLQLWPPSGEDNLEARLGAWWATRAGMLLAVIGVVFFAVYVSRNTPAWVRFTELLAVSAGVAGLGLWLENKIEKFGAVVFAGGLALIYFCAFAAFAVAPVKVLDSGAAASGWQLAAVTLFVGAAVWRRSPTIATIGTGLGYVTAVFSHAEGLHAFALAEAWLLAAVAVIFCRWRRWEAPSVLALPATYAVYGLVLAGDWPGGDAPGRGWVWLLLAQAGGIFFARDWRSRRVPTAEVRAGEQWFQGVNSGLLVLAGVATALLLYPSHLAEFYFGATALLGVMTWLRRRQVEGDAVAAMLLAQAAGAFTLGVIAQAEGRTLAPALLVQAWVMLAGARRMKSRLPAAGAGLVALVACGYFARDAQLSEDVWSATAGGAVAFVTGLALLAVEIAQQVGSEEDPDLQQGVEAAGAALAGVLGVVAVANWRPEAWVPAWMAGLAVLLAAAGAARRAWGPVLAGGLVLLVGNRLLAQAAMNPEPGGARLWWEALAVLAPTVALGGLLAGRRGAQAAGAGAAQFAIAGIAAWALAVAGIVLVFFNEWPATMALAAAGGLALGLAAALPGWPERRLPWLATLAAAAGVARWFYGGAGTVPPWELVVATATYWALPVGLAALPRHARLMRREPAAGQLRAVQLALATVVLLKAGGGFFAGTALVLVFALLALGAGMLVWWPGIAAALPGSWVFWLAAGGVALADYFGHGGPPATQALPVLAALLAWVPALTLTHAQPLPAFGTHEPAWRRAGVGVQVTLAVLGSMLVGGVYFEDAARLVVLTGALVTATLVLRLGLVPAARPGTGALAVAAGLAALALVVQGGAEGWGAGLAAVWLVAGALVALPLALAGGPRALTPRERQQFAWLQAAAGLGLAFFACGVQTGTLRHEATIGWGLAATGVFLTGLFTRLRPHRLVGLAGLALCVPRVFLVDLDSALHRILAFIVLGGVLLWVGFSYHRFRHLIVEDDVGPPDQQ